jgi:hypothetical protein
MSEVIADFFTTFPRRKLLLNVSRRQFFSALWHELDGVNSQLEGRSTFKLSDLGDLPDDKLADVIPVIMPGCKVWEEGEFMWTQLNPTAKPEKLFRSETPILVVLDLIDGSTPLQEISQRLSREMNWEASYSFAYVRGLFLSLVFAKVCFPTGPLTS